MDKISAAIVEFTKTPRTILECNKDSIGVECTYQQFHECWTKLVDNGTLKFTEGGGKGLKPILCYIEENDAK